jgi:hypothetical protein
MITRKVNLQKNPYTSKYHPSWGWYNGFHEIQFQDTTILITGSKKETKEILRALNGAYIMGASDVAVACDDIELNIDSL